MCYVLTKYEGETQIRNTILLRKTKKSVDSYMTVIGAFKKNNCYVDTGCPLHSGLDLGNWRGPHHFASFIHQGIGLLLLSAAETGETSDSKMGHWVLNIDANKSIFFVFC